MFTFYRSPDETISWRQWIWSSINWQRDNCREEYKLLALNFLESKTADNYMELILNRITLMHRVQYVTEDAFFGLTPGCFPLSIGEVSDEYNERIHLRISSMEKSYQEKQNLLMFADFWWMIFKDATLTIYKQQAKRRRKNKINKSLYLKGNNYLLHMLKYKHMQLWHKHKICDVTEIIRTWNAFRYPFFQNRSTLYMWLTAFILKQFIQHNSGCMKKNSNVTYNGSKTLVNYLTINW